MICASCGTTNTDDASFCNNCGQSLASGCPQCGTENPPQANFCNNCGSSLGGVGAPETQADPSERRLVSALFADLVGFTPLSESRDAEDVRSMLLRYFEQAQRVVERFGGQIDKYTGDAVTAFWGARQTREDDAERAVRAALELVDSVAELSEGLVIPVFGCVRLSSAARPALGLGAMKPAWLERGSEEAIKEFISTAEQHGNVDGEVETAKLKAILAELLPDSPLARDAGSGGTRVVHRPWSQGVCRPVRPGLGGYRC